MAHAHRVAYELLVGPVPDGLHLDHLCRNRWCCNPAHCEPVTIGENLRRGDGPSGRNLRKTHCVNGHPFVEGNIYITTEGARKCRVCKRAEFRKWRASHPRRAHGSEASVFTRTAR